MKKELGLFRQLVTTVFEKHLGAYQNPSKAVRTILDTIPYQYSQFSDSAALGNYLPTKDEPTTDFKEALRFMYLRPIEKGTPMVPVVSLKANFARSIPEVRIRLALFLLDSEEQIRSIGYRFETPEGPGNGRHDYYHVQPIQELHRDRRGFTLSTPSWLPVAHPAWPIDAGSPVGLFISLLLSLYGLPFYNELLTYPVADALKTYLDDTHYLNIPRPWYWQVQCGGTTFHYATRHQPREFEAFCETKHVPRYKKRTITEAEYSAANQAEQLIC